MLGFILLLVVQPTAPAGERPQALATVLECRAIDDADRRLACFDATVDRLARAEEAREIVVVDRTLVRREQRRQFGFEGVRLPFFGDRDAESAPERIASTVTAVRNLGYGRWTVQLAEGGTWRTTDRARYEPLVGQSVVIRRAALGSFVMSINNRNGVRALRVQ